MDPTAEESKLIEAAWKYYLEVFSEVVENNGRDGTVNHSFTLFWVPQFIQEDIQELTRTQIENMTFRKVWEDTLNIVVYKGDEPDRLREMIREKLADLVRCWDQLDRQKQICAMALKINGLYSAAKQGEKQDGYLNQWVRDISDKAPEDVM